MRDRSQDGEKEAVKEEKKAAGSKRTTLEHLFTNKNNNKEKGTNIVDETGEETTAVSSKNPMRELSQFGRVQDSILH